MKMNVKLSYMGKTENADNRIIFTLNSKIEVQEEVLAKTSLSLIAEVGGYLGLTLGVSLLDAKKVIMFLTYWIKKNYHFLKKINSSEKTLPTKN